MNKTNIIESNMSNSTLNVPASTPSSGGSGESAPSSNRESVVATPSSNRESVVAAPSSNRESVVATPSSNRESVVATPSSNRESVVATPSSNREQPNSYDLGFILSLRKQYLNIHEGIKTFKHEDTSYKLRPSSTSIIRNNLSVDDIKQFEKELNTSMNKITEENYMTIINEIISIGFDSEAKIKSLASLIVRNALFQPNFTAVYAKCCKRFDTIEYNGAPFIKILVNCIRETFINCIEIDPTVAKEMNTTEQDPIKNKRVGICKFIAELSLVLPIDNIIIKCTNIIFTVIKACNDSNYTFARDIVMECLIDMINIINTMQITNPAILAQLNEAEQIGKSYKSPRLRILMELAIGKIKK
jgi:hypothetical protein